MSTTSGIDGHVGVGRLTIISMMPLRPECRAGGPFRNISPMYATYWGLTEIPFKNTLDTRWFYESPGHEEALARLIFLVEQHRRCGVLSGPAGSGKSLVLEFLRRETLRTGAEVAAVDLIGLSCREMLWEILAALGRSTGIDDSPHRLWRLLHDHITANHEAHVPLVLILDHLDRAQPECVVAVERLQHLSAGGHSD